MAKTNVNYCPPEVSEEDVIMVFRMHWIDRLRRVAFGILFILGGLALGISGGALLPSLREAPWSNFLLLGSSLIVLFGWGATAYGLSLYLMTVATVTRTSLVDVDQSSLFDRKISTLNLEQVQDVTVRQHGLLATFWDFGDVVVQTAGELPEFIFDTVPHPQQIATEILRAQQEKSI